MHPRLAALAASQDGVFTAQQAHACGYSSFDIQRQRRLGHWCSLRRGVYAQAALLDGLDPLARHRLEARALMLVLEQPAVLSHVTAAAWLGLEMLTPDLSRLHVTRPERHASRDEADVHHHAASLPAELVQEVDGLLVTTRARTAVDVAREAPFAQGVAVVDSALRSGVSAQDLREVMLSCAVWPGARTASRAVAFGDGRAANPGESLSRVVLAELGLMPDELQFRVDDEDGLIGYSDFAWKKSRTLGELDGQLKYKVPPGASPEEAAQIVWREKRREDRLRGRGWEVVRWTFGELYNPLRLGAKVRRARARGERRPA